MRKFIFKFTLLIAIIIASLFVLQILIFLRTNGKSTTGHDNLDITSDVNSELVFMGSSRCWAHFDPVFFEKTFNLKSTNIGVDGHSEISMAYIRLLDYLKYNSPPKYAILSFDPYISAGKFNKVTGNKVHKDRFARYAFRLLNKKWEIVDYFGFNSWEKNFPLLAIFKYKQVSNCIFQNNVSTYLKYGYERHDIQWDTLNMPSAKEKHIQIYSIGKQHKEVVNALNKLNRFCNKYEIKLICIQTPVFQKIYDFKTFQIPANICSELEIPFIDANYESIRKATENFYNANHLNINGVTALNNKFKNEKQLISLLK